MEGRQRHKLGDGVVNRGRDGWEHGYEHVGLRSRGFD